MPTEPAAVPPHRGAPWEERYRVARRLVARRAPQGLVRIGLRERVPPTRFAVWSARLELRDAGGAPDPEVVEHDLVRVWQLLNQPRDEGVVASSHGAPVVIAWLLASVDAGDWEAFLTEELVVLPAADPYIPWPGTVPDPPRVRRRPDPVDVALGAAEWASRLAGYAGLELALFAVLRVGQHLVAGGVPAAVVLLGALLLLPAGGVGLVYPLVFLDDGRWRRGDPRFPTPFWVVRVRAFLVWLVAVVPVAAGIAAAAVAYPDTRPLVLAPIPLILLGLFGTGYAENARWSRGHRVHPRHAVRRLVAARAP